MSKPVYKIKNRSQVDALMANFARDRGVFEQTLAEVLRYINGADMSSVLNVTRDEAIHYVECGVFMLAKHSRRMRTRRVEISPELEVALRRAIELSKGKKYLFEASLCESNRAQSTGRPVTRQAVYNWFKSAQPETDAASKNSGVSNVGFISARSLLAYNQGSMTMRDAIDSLITTYGDKISNSLLSELYRELHSLTASELKGE